jgi:hypothetical protein
MRQRSLEKLSIGVQLLWAGNDQLPSRHGSPRAQMGTMNEVQVFIVDKHVDRVHSPQFGCQVGDEGFAELGSLTEVVKARPLQLERARTVPANSLVHSIGKCRCYRFDVKLGHCSPGSSRAMNFADAQLFSLTNGADLTRHDHSPAAKACRVRHTPFD